MTDSIIAFPGHRDKHLIFLTTYFSFDEVSLKLAVIIFQCEGHSCKGQKDEISFRPVNSTLCIWNFADLAKICMQRT